MRIISYGDSDLWFKFSNEVMYWDYSLIGSNLVWCGVWFYREGDFYEKELRELKWR